MALFKVNRQVTQNKPFLSNFVRKQNKSYSSTSRWMYEENLFIKKALLSLRPSILYAWNQSSDVFKISHDGDLKENYYHYLAYNLTSMLFILRPAPRYLTKVLIYLMFLSFLEMSK